MRLCKLSAILGFSLGINSVVILLYVLDCLFGKISFNQVIIPLIISIILELGYVYQLIHVINSKNV